MAAKTRGSKSNEKQDVYTVLKVSSQKLLVNYKMKIIIIQKKLAAILSPSDQS